MTVIIEVSGPIQWRPWVYAGRAMYRVGWLWFVIGVLRVPFEEFYETAYVARWSEE